MELQQVSINRDHRYKAEILTPDCLKFLAALHRNFNKTRKVLLQARKERQKLFDRGFMPTFPPETKHIRDGQWQVAPYPKELDKRWIEITGPATFKGCINAMNTNSDVFMADFEDALAPSWLNLLNGQKALIQTNQRTLHFKQDGKEYKFRNGLLPTLLVRPRGWHLEEWNISVDGESMSGSMFDFGVYFFHNFKIRMEQYGGVFYYLPKMEAYQEARLWEDIFTFSENYFKVPIGTIRCTVLIETILGGIEMEEILYELKNHITACNAGRWDYIFSCIKKFKNIQSSMFPDRTEVTMTVPFMRAYTERLVQVCHKRGAHAIGGMAAFIPSKSDQEYNEFVKRKVIEDKTREVNDGFDGSWVAHPGLVDLARQVFIDKLRGKDHQKEKLRSDVHVTSEEMLNFKINKPITENGIRMNINVCFQYIYNWLLGSGAVGIHNLMEDAATAEISRSQLWQWLRYRVKTDKGVIFTEALYNQYKEEELKKYLPYLPNKAALDRAVEITDWLVFHENLQDFLTIPGYKLLLNFEMYNKPKL